MSNSLRVLLADPDAGREACLERRLTELGTVILRARAGASLLEAVVSQAADVLVISMAQPDAATLEELRQIAATNALPIVLFVGRDDRAFMEEAIAAGVGSYNVVGTALPDVKPIVRTAVALFRRYRQIEEELAAAQASLAESAVIDKAKTRLIRQRQLSEPEAYRLLRRRAMNEGRRIADIAREILASEG